MSASTTVLIRAASNFQKFYWSGSLSLSTPWLHDWNGFFETSLTIFLTSLEDNSLGRPDPFIRLTCPNSLYLLIHLPRESVLLIPAAIKCHFALSRKNADNLVNAKSKCLLQSCAHVTEFNPRRVASSVWKSTLRCSLRECGAPTVHCPAACTALLFGTICQAKFDCYAWATICVKTCGLHATLVGKISFYKMFCCVVYDKFTQKCIVMR
jgi:hypothetical protein